MYSKNNPITKPVDRVAKTSGPWLIVDCVCQSWASPFPGKLSHVKVLFDGMDPNYKKLQLKDFVPLKEPTEARRLIEDHARPHTKEFLLRVARMKKFTFDMAEVYFLARKAEQWKNLNSLYKEGTRRAHINNEVGYVLENPVKRKTRWIRKFLPQKKPKI